MGMPGSIVTTRHTDGPTELLPLSCVAVVVVAVVVAVIGLLSTG